MAAPKRSSNNLERVLKAAFTPASPIDHPRLFSGRLELFREAQEVLDERGRNLVLYGEYSVGKTSFWQVLTRGRKVVDYVCTKVDDFSDIFLNVLRRCGGDLIESERSSSAEYSSGASRRGFSVSGKRTSGRKLTPIALPRLNQTFVMEQIQRRRRHVDTIVLDEFDKVRDDATQDQIIELVASLATNPKTSHITTVLVGIGIRDSALLNTDAYKMVKDRYWSAKRIKRLSALELENIFEQRRRFFHIKFDPDAVTKICTLSSGLPNVAHEIASSLA